MKIEAKVGQRSMRELKTARKNYNAWMNRSKESKIYRAVLYALSDGDCPVCGRHMIMSFHGDQGDNLATLDHTLPLSVTLEHKKVGLEIMCQKCNFDKGSKLPNKNL